MRYRLEKLIDGQWYEEGTYTEGYYVRHLAHAAYILGKHDRHTKDIRVVIISDKEEDNEHA